MKAQTFGRNVKVSEDGDDIVIRINKKVKAEPSKSEKTNILATTQGNVNLGDGTYLGLNCYRYAGKKAKK